MKLLRLTIPSILLLVACRKQLEVYTPEINRSIHAQTAGLLIIQDFVNMHTEMSGNFAGFSNCFSRTADTTAGNMIYDTVTVNMQTGCDRIKNVTPTGGFTSVYPNKASFSAGDKALITFQNFSSNGFTYSGTISYVWLMTDSVHITTQNLVLTNQSGTSTITTDMTLKLGGETALFGSMSSTGSEKYAWLIADKLTGKGTTAKTLSGVATLTIGEQVLKENFGNGEEDDFATFEDKTEVRKIFKLPVL